MAPRGGFESNLISMKLLISEEEFSNSKRDELVPLECYQCKQIFYLTKHDIQRRTQKENPCSYCSNKCRGKAQITKQIVICEQCGKECKNALVNLKSLSIIFVVNLVLADITMLIKLKELEDLNLSNT